MKKNLILLIFLSGICFAQAQKKSPYTTDWVKDGIWITAGFAGSAAGLLLIMDKEDLTEEKLATLSKDDIWGIDRWAAGNDSESASKISDVPFYLSFGTPFLLLLDKETRSHSGQISVLLLESLSTTATLFSITAGLVERSRPRVYDENLELGERLVNDNQRSFYSGHVAASATATFFAAQVFSDFFPDSPAKPYIWAGAAIVPAIVGHYRIQSGNHFLSDVLVGYALGAASGIFIPKLHKIKDSNLEISPGLGFRSQTLNVRYTF